LAATGNKSAEAALAAFAVVELVEVAHGLHVPLEVRARIEYVEDPNTPRIAQPGLPQSNIRGCACAAAARPHGRRRAATKPARMTS